MPFFDRDTTSIYFEEQGSGFPLLLIAPGGMRSTIESWRMAAINPLAAFASDFRLIAMDQRNAGRSRGPLVASDPWGAYAADQLGLLDSLGIDRFLVMGCCIGGSYILKLVEQAPERVVAGVLEQPIGVLESNRELFGGMQRSWGEELLAGGRSDLDAEELSRFLGTMWKDDFVVSVGREVVSACPVPLLVLPGTDDFHPARTGREIAALAPLAQTFDPWKDTPEDVASATEAVRRFLLSHAARS